MGNIEVHKEATSPTIARREAWDPFRTMQELMRWDPFGVSPSLFRAAQGEAFAPAFEVKETKDAFEFSADVPGIDSKDIDVKLTSNRLTISGKREAEKREKSDTFYSYERSYGSFSRAFTLPEGVNGDAVRADLKDGVLKVQVPKAPEAKARQVLVKSG